MFLRSSWGHARAQRWLVIAAALSLAGFGCSKKKTRPAKAAAGSTRVGAIAPLTSATVQALLYRCEARAQVGDVKGFRQCLTEASGARLEKQFKGVRARLHRAALEADATRREALALEAKARVAVAPQLAALDAQRLRLAALMARVSWKAHLLLIAKSPRSEVRSLGQKGVHAKFVKRVPSNGKTRDSWHTLAFERGAWRVDLLGNPDFARRLVGLEGAVTQNVAALRSARATLQAALSRLGPAKRALGTREKAPKKK